MQLLKSSSTSDIEQKQLAQEIAVDGFAVRSEVLDECTVTRVEEWWQDKRARIQQGLIGRSSVHVQVRTGQRGSTDPNDGFFNRLHEHPALLSLARAVIGDDICHFMSRLLLKDSSVPAPVECHQDWPYFGGGTHKVALMVPLTRHTDENGKLYYLRGSHRFGPVPCGAIDYERYPELERVGPDLELGDILVHDFLTWHYSGPCRSSEDRAVIQIVYQSSADPSSKALVSGRMLNPYSCGHPADPMARVDVSPRLSLSRLRGQWRTGDDGARDVARKVCEGLIKDGDSGILSAHAALVELAVDAGNLPAARRSMRQLRAEYEAFGETIAQLDATLTRHDVVLADVDLSSIHPLNGGVVEARADDVSLVTDPALWAYSAEVKIQMPDLVAAAFTVRVQLHVEDGIVGVGWLSADGSEWVVRESASPGALERDIDLVIVPEARSGRLVFDNWTPGDKSARAVIGSVRVLASDPPHASER